MRIAIGSDHAGVNLKAEVAGLLAELGHEVDDKGPASADSVDYPLYAAMVAGDVASGKADRGVLVCGSGVGMSITANRFKGVRAVLASAEVYARLGREHNNANLLCLGERLTPADEALSILKVFLNTEFAGDRHQRRVDMIDTLGEGDS